MNRKERYDFLINNIKGIGPARAEKIADAFEYINSFLEILDDSSMQEKLQSLIGQAATKNMFDQLLEIKRQDADIQKMVECGVPYFAATNIAKTEMLFNAFQKDPYTIGKQNGLSFASCDKFAHMLFWESETPDMSKARMQFFIDAMLEELENSGHTFAYLAQLTKKINQYQKSNEYLPDSYANSTLILYLVDNDNVEVEKHKNIKKWKIYRKQTAQLENDIAYHIKRLSINKTKFSDNELEPNTGIKYDSIQLDAIKSVNNSGLKIITGPPGSGKTAVINGIITSLRSVKDDAKIILCAPTGRAAKHMTEITGMESATIHKLLGIRESNQFIKKDKLQCDMVICDEASMLNLDITFELMSRIKTGTVIYFVGDKDQLPAVGPGNVLHDIIASNVVPVYQLTKVYRQDGIILENAHKINKGELPTKTSKQYISQTYADDKSLKNAAVEWFKAHYDPNEPFESQILVPSYKTDCGITALNLAIQDLNPENYIYKSASQKCAYKKNDKILMTKNSKDGLYQNGSVGLFLYNLGEEIVVEFDGEEVTLPKYAIDDMTLGYAISVHKAQGSEYKHVLLCLPNKPANMLKRNIVYTAVTRAKEDMTVYEMTGALQKAIDTNLELFMQTGLSSKLSC